MVDCRHVATSTGLVEYLPVSHSQRQQWLPPGSPKRRFPLTTHANHLLISFSPQPMDLDVPEDQQNTIYSYLDYLPTNEASQTIASVKSGFADHPSVKKRLDRLSISNDSVSAYLQLVQQSVPERHRPMAYAGLVELLARRNAVINADVAKAVYKLLSGSMPSVPMDLMNMMLTVLLNAEMRQIAFNEVSQITAGMIEAYLFDSETHYDTMVTTACLLLKHAVFLRIDSHAFESLRDWGVLNAAQVQCALVDFSPFCVNYRKPAEAVKTQLREQQLASALLWCWRINKLNIPLSRDVVERVFAKFVAAGRLDAAAAWCQSRLSQYSLSLSDDSILCFLRGLDCSDRPDLRSVRLIYRQVSIAGTLKQSKSQTDILLRFARVFAQYSDLPSLLECLSRLAAIQNLQQKVEDSLNSILTELCSTSHICPINAMEVFCEMKALFGVQFDISPLSLLKTLKSKGSIEMYGRQILTLIVKHSASSNRVTQKTVSEAIHSIIYKRNVSLKDLQTHSNQISRNIFDLRTDSLF